MPYPPLKTENYKNIGGVNKKASPYMTGENEVLDILNFDYTQPGSYTVRPGSTAYGAVVPSLGGQGPVASIYQFARLNGASFLLFSNSNALYSYDGSTTAQLQSPILVANVLSFAPFVDRLFLSGGQSSAVNLSFIKTDGVNAWKYSLPAAQFEDLFGNVVGNTFSIDGNISYGSAVGVTGVYVYAFSFINERGYLGPTGLSGVPGAGLLGSSFITPSLGSSLPYFPCVQLALAGTTFVAFFNYAGFGGISLPPSFGISYLCLFRAGPFATFQVNVPNMFDLAVLPIGGTMFSDTCNNATLGVFDNQTGNTLYSTSLYFTLAPSFLNIYNNALFSSGFTSQQSTIYYSAIGEPELVGFTQSFQLRTNDSDVVTGMYNYLSQQMIFKNRSFFSLTGTSPPYPNVQISDQYGCISNRAIVSFNSLLWFLDQKGIVQYDGANVGIISNRMEPVFKSMNLSAAKQRAIMIHVKARNEIWTAIPVNGATFNNHMVIYDYVANAWSEWSGPLPASMIMGVDPNQAQTPIYGGQSANIQYFNSGLFTDGGQGFTCSVTPRYFGGMNNEMGFSIEKLFRRLYFDISDLNNTGQTTIMSVNLLNDFGTSHAVQNQTFAMAGGFTQTRLDFGVAGKAMTYQLSFVPQTAALNFNGYTIEYRYQRNE